MPSNAPSNVENRESAQNPPTSPCFSPQAHLDSEIAKAASTSTIPSPHQPCRLALMLTASGAPIVRIMHGPIRTTEYQRSQSHCRACTLEMYLYYTHGNAFATAHSTDHCITFPSSRSFPRSLPAFKSFSSTARSRHKLRLFLPFHRRGH